MAHLEIRENVPLAPFTTLGIGGSARYFVRAESDEQVSEAVRFAADRSLDLFVLGGGSNALISDSGFDGLTLQIGLRGMDVETGPVADAMTLVTVQAGEDWDGFVRYCVENDLAGVECMSGIPGFVGGTPIQNVGAYGQEVSDTIMSVRCLDRVTMQTVDLSHTECGFSYRSSIFNSTLRGRYIVLSVTFALKRGGEPRMTYKDLREIFGERQPSLAEVRDSVLAIRRAKSMVIDPHDPNWRSAGSFFKNPVVELRRLGALKTANSDIPHFAFGPGLAKIPAAWLIENSGFKKGFTLGSAGISSNHSLALINRGGASAAELIALMEVIQRGVNDKFGIELQPEPVFIGFE